MAQAKEGDTVKVNYTGKLDNGDVFDSSEEHGPLEFTIGTGEVIEGFEEGVTGMSPGEKKTITIPAEKAYGTYDDEAAFVVERSEFPEDIDPKVGDQLELTDEDGETVVVTVTEAHDCCVTLDANHPLAGKDLTFELELVGIE